MADFAAQIAGGEKRKGGKGFEEYKLARDYALQDNNCTTICLGAMGNAQSKTKEKFPGYAGFKGENDPRDLFKDVGKVKDAGVSVRERERQ